MNKALNVIKAILVVGLLLCIIAFGMIQIASSTILSQSYVLKQLEEANYYANIYTEIKSDFENYIYQSGLDESVLENIITVEEVTQDTNQIIANIYNGDNKQIDVTALKERLNNNIKESLSGQRINSSTQKAIDEFVNKIADQYIETMSHKKIKKTVQIEIFFDLHRHYPNFQLIL